jgi:uncharacterized membrane protein YphA (DoxX/SURF4 family)
MLAPRRYFFYGLCWFIGALFIYAGAGKLVNPILSAEAVRNYELIGDPWVTVVTLLLPWVEIVAGTLLLIGCWLPGALAVVAGCSVVFLGAIGSAWVRGLDISCGCFGPATAEGAKGPVDYAIHSVGLVMLLIACVWLWRQLAAVPDRAVAEADAPVGS